MKTKRRPVAEVYPAADGYRWRLKAANGRIIADSGEAYAKRGNAARAAKCVIWSALRATLVHTY